jgi:hypothetical protein
VEKTSLPSSSDCEKTKVIPILLAGVERSGFTAILSALGADPRVAYRRAYPFANHSLLLCYKTAVLLENPHLLQFLHGVHLFNFHYLGFDGEPPPYNYVSEANPRNFLLHVSLQKWLGDLWRTLSRNPAQTQCNISFYAERVPYWFPAEFRQCSPCFTIYNFRDPRDVLISARALIARKTPGEPRSIQPRDEQNIARRVVFKFLQTFENYRADKDRADTLLVRYEDLLRIPTETASCVRQKFGVEAGVPDSTYLATVATAPDLPSSLNRWQREALPAGTSELFISTLREEMINLGYEIKGDESRRSLHLQRGKIDPSALSAKQGKIELHADCGEVHVQGRDFHLTLPFEPFDAEEIRFAWISVNTDVGEVCSVYWRSRENQFSEERVVYTRLTPSPHWTVLSFPLHEHPGWKGRIHELRLDLFNFVNRGLIRRWRAPYPPSKGTGRIRWVKLVA